MQFTILEFPLCQGHVRSILISLRLLSYFEPCHIPAITPDIFSLSLYGTTVLPISSSRLKKRNLKKIKKAARLRIWLMAFYTGAAQLNLPRSPDVYAHQCFAMNAALPSIRPVVLAWSTTWRPNHRINSASAPLTPPKTSTFEAKSTAHIHASSSPPLPYSTHIQMDHQDATDHRPSSSSTILPPIAQLDRQIHNLPPCEYFHSPSGPFFFLGPLVFILTFSFQ